MSIEFANRITVGDFTGTPNAGFPNYATIAEAVAAAPHDTVILLAAGTHDVAATITLNAAGLRLGFIGMGAAPTDTVIRAPANNTQSFSVGYTDTLVVFDNLDFVTRHANVESKNIYPVLSQNGKVIYNRCRFRGVSAHYGLFLNGTRYTSSAYLLEPQHEFHNCTFLAPSYGVFRWCRLGRFAIHKSHLASGGIHFQSFDAPNPGDYVTGAAVVDQYGIDFGEQYISLTPAIENFKSDNKFALTWDPVLDAASYELVINHGPQVVSGFFSYGSPVPSLLLPLTDEAGTDPFEDQSPSAQAVTVGGAPAVDGATSYGYTSSLYFGGGGSLTMPRLLDTDTWTVECYFRLANISGWKTIWQQYASSSTAGRTIVAVENATLRIFQNGVWSDSVILEATTWYHIACSCDAGTLKVFIDGEEVLSRSGFLVPENTNFRVAGTWNMFVGNMQDVRVLPGVALYPSKFILPGPLVSLP